MSSAVIAQWKAIACYFNSEDHLLIVDLYQISFLTSLALFCEILEYDWQSETLSKKSLLKIRQRQRQEQGGSCTKGYFTCIPYSAKVSYNQQESGLPSSAYKAQLPLCTFHWALFLTNFLKMECSHISIPAT